MMPDPDPHPTQPAMLPVPQYEPPGLSIRATFLATDGSRPQELILEWKSDPGTAVLDFALDAIIDMARPSEVAVQTDRPASRMEQIRQAGQTGRIGPFGTSPPLGNIDAEHGTVPNPPELFPVCAAEGPGHLRRDGHGCVLDPDHDPVEPDGRRHRCRCGGIFGTEDEHPAVPGQARKADRRAR